jgi:hypothetical protein
VAQTGCTGTQRCTWISTGQAPNGLATGFLQCVPNGTADAGAACSIPDGGHDECQAGLFCLGGTSGHICNLNTPVCTPNNACLGYSEFFVDDGGIPFVGLCVPECNPVTQVRLTDNAPNCGSVNSPAERGCYGVPGGSYTCASAGPPTNVSDVVISPVFENSCAAGFGSLLFDTWMKGGVICSAYCQPAPTSNMATSGAAGVPGSGYTCGDRGAGGSHECRYLDFLEPMPDTNGRTWGLCVDYTKYKWDSNMNTMIDAADMNYPSCTTLSATGHVYDPTLTDTQLWGCEPAP